MKKLLCYLGILVLLLLILTPPALRIFLKDKKDEIIIKPLDTKLLACTNSNYITTTSYKDEKIDVIMIKKIKNSGQNVENNNEQDELTETELENNDNNELDQIFQTLSNNQNVVFTIMEDGELIKIDFSVSDFSDVPIISKLNNNLNAQKIYYENMKLICNVR